MVITWLNGATQKHHRIIFGFLLVVVAVSFVFYTGAGRSGHLGGNPTYLGVDLYNPRALERFDDALRLNGGVSDNRQRTLELCLAIARKHLADELDLPTPTAAEVEERFSMILTRGAPRGSQPDAKTREAYFNMVQQTLGCNRTEALARLQTAIEDSVRWERAARLLAGPGHASAAAVRRTLEDYGAKWTVEVAQLDAATFAPAIVDDLAKARAHFAANAENHRIPARLTVRAVTFPAPAANPARPVTDDEVMTHAYNFATELGIEAGKVADAVKSRRAEIEQRVRARAAVEEAAARISDELAERFPGARPAPAALDAWIKSQGGVARDLPAFDAGSEVTAPGVPASAIESAAALGNEGWHTDAYPTAGGPLLIIVQDRTPSRLPDFDEVKEKALADWRQAERNRQFILRANEAGKTLAGAVEQGKPFADAARALGLTVLASPAPFAAEQTPDNLQGVNLPTLSVLSETTVGKVGAPLRVAGGNFVYLRVVKREAPAIDTAGESFRNVLAQVERQNARTTLFGEASLGFEPEGASSRGLLDELTSDPTGIAPAAR